MTTTTNTKIFTPEFISALKRNGVDPDMGCEGTCAALNELFETNKYKAKRVRQALKDAWKWKNFEHAAMKIAIRAKRKTLPTEFGISVWIAKHTAFHSKYNISAALIEYHLLRGTKDAGNSHMNWDKDD